MAKGQNALHSKVNKKATRGNASARGRRGKATKPKVRYSKRSVASTTIRRERSPRAAARNSRHKNEVPANLTLMPPFPVHRGRKKRCGGTVRVVSKNHIHIGRILRVVPRADGNSANQRTEAPKEFRSSHRVPFPSGIFPGPESAGEGASRTVCRQHLCPVPQSDQAQLRASGSVVNVSFRKRAP